MLLYCLEVENEGVSTAVSSSSAGTAAAAAAMDLEAQTYTLFCRFMDDVELLYDPTPLPHAAGNHPAIVPYLVDMQDCRLAYLDPPLHRHLRACDVHPQMYGLRWARLLLGREFSLVDGQLLVLWDLLVASASRAGSSSSSGSSSSGSSSSSSGSSGSGGGACGPLLEGLRDVMLAMLIHVRRHIPPSDPPRPPPLLSHSPLTSRPVSTVITRLSYCIRSPLTRSYPYTTLQIREELLDGDETAALTHLMRYELIHLRPEPFFNHAFAHMHTNIPLAIFTSHQVPKNGLGRRRTYHRPRRRRATGDRPRLRRRRRAKLGQVSACLQFPELLLWRPLPQQRRVNSNSHCCVFTCDTDDAQRDRPEPAR